MFRYSKALMFQLVAIFLAWMLMNMHVSPAVSSPLPPETGALGELVRLPGHILSALKGATPVAPLPGAEADPVTLTVVLKRTDQAGFDRYLHEVYDPASPEFRHFLSQGEITARYGPTPEAYEDVLAYLQQNGFTLVHGSANHMTLTVRSTRAQAESAFGVHIGDFEAGGRRFFANDTDPMVPRDLALKIQALAGLVQIAPRGAVKELPATTSTQVTLVQAAQIGFVGAFKVFVSYLLLPATILGIENGIGAVGVSVAVWLWILITLYNVHSPTGAGQKIGIPAFSSFRMSDVADGLALAGLPANLIGQVNQVDVNGGAPLGRDQTDVLLAITTILALAPGAQVVVYDAPFTGPGTSFQALFNAMINDGVTIISNSFSYCEDETTLADVQSIDALLVTAAASGISVLNATGDTGMACHDGSANTVAVPASSPHATAVGGTSLTVGPGFTYGGESWWDGSGQIPPTGQGGFGVSRFFSRPAYQNSLITSPMRSIPDVVAPANPDFGPSVCEADAGGCPTGRAYGGTSLATPIWAAFIARINERAGHPLGFLNPLLYPLAGTGALHSAASMGTDEAHVGLGSPNANLLELALAGIIPGPVDAALSVVARHSSPDPRVPFFGTVPADGSTAASIAVRLRDANGDTVAGKTVTLSASPGSHVVINPPSGVSSVDNGAIVFTVTDATVESVTFTATADGVTLAQTATVQFIGPPPTAASISANPTTVTADGGSSTTITVTLQAQGHGVPGKVVTIAQGNGSSQLAQTTAATDATGQIKFTATDFVAEAVTYTATDITDGLPIPGSATVNFVNPSGFCATFGRVGLGTAAAGYAVTTFVSGFPNDCFTNAGPIGLAFDAQGTLLVGDVFNNVLYKFGPQGGTAGLATQVGPVLSNGNNLAGLAFTKDGRLYAALQQNPGKVVELDPTNAAVLRTVVNFNNATALATDPISGDLFVSNFDGVQRISNFANGPGTLTPYFSSEFTDGIVFAPDGTLYVKSGCCPDFVARVAGTNTANPGAATIIAYVDEGDGMALEANPADPSKPFLYVNRTNGIITRIDTSALPATPTDPCGSACTDIYTGGTRGDFVTVGADGCLYATQSERVIKVTKADGSCSLLPVNPAPQLVLAPQTITPSPAQGTPETFTASFRNLSVPTGTPVTLAVIGPNLQALLERTDATSQAAFTYAGTFTGTDALVATATVGTQTLTSNVAQVTWTAGPHTTFLSLNTSRSSGPVNTPLPLTATLVDVSASPAAVVPNATLHFALAGQTCTGTTDSTGKASCAITPQVAAGAYPLNADFLGTNSLLASSASKTVDLVTVSPVQQGFKNSDFCTYSKGPLPAGACPASSSIRTS